MDPLVSVVIPSYNRGHLIAETLDSVLQQTYPRLEIIVVDDGSTDATGQVVARFSDRVRYIRQENQGLAGARNTGHAESTGDYIAWLDSDDLWNPEKTAVQVAFMQAHPDHVLVATDFSAFDADGYFDKSHLAVYYTAVGKAGGSSGIFDRRIVLRTEGLAHVGTALPETIDVYSGNVYQSLVRGNFLHPPTVLFRKDAALRAGPLQRHFGFGVDYEFFVRMSHLGPIGLVNHPLMRYRYTPDQMSSDRYLTDIRLSRMQILEELRSRDPALLSERSFRRMLGGSHLAVAHSLADVGRGRAINHLWRSLYWGHVDAKTVRTLVKLVLPNWMVQKLKKEPSV